LQATYRRASRSFGLAPPAIGSPSGPARFLTPLSESRAESGATRRLTQLGGECELMIRTCIVPGGLTRPTGDLGLQLSRRTDHVETWSPPYVPYSTDCSRGNDLLPVPCSRSRLAGSQPPEMTPTPRPGLTVQIRVRKLMTVVKYDNTRRESRSWKLVGPRYRLDRSSRSIRMAGVSSQQPDVYRARRRIVDDPVAAAKARAKTQRLFERMDRLERATAGFEHRWSLVLPGLVRRSVSAKVPARRSRRVRSLASRRGAGGCRSPDPDLPPARATARREGAEADYLLRHPRFASCRRGGR
jgi:hypothetical protein